jgi:hypothetical protein
MYESKSSLQKNEVIAKIELGFNSTMNTNVYAEHQYYVLHPPPFKVYFIVATSAIYCRVMLLLDLTILLVKFTVQ